MDRRYQLDVRAERTQDLLLRVAGVLARQQVSVLRLQMADRDDYRYLEATVELDPRRLELVCGRLRNLVAVHEVTPWPHSA